MLAFEHLAIFGGQHLDEFAPQSVPLIQQAARYRAVGILQMARDEGVELLSFALAAHLAQLHHAGIAALGEATFLVQDVSYAAAHPGGEITSGAPQYHHQAAGHILAAMVAHTFDHRERAAVANGKTLAGDTADKGLAAGGAVERHVAHHNILFGLEAGLARRTHRDKPARQSFAAVIIGVALQIKRDAASQKSAEALTRRPLQQNLNRIGWQALLAKA